jgi:hypothetical protein
MVVKCGNISLAVRFFHSTVAHIGFLRWLRAAGPALIESLMTRLSRRLSHKVEIVVSHEPAATMLDHPSDR